MNHGVIVSPSPPIFWSRLATGLGAVGLGTVLLIGYGGLLAGVPGEAWNAARVFPAHLIASGASPYSLVGETAATGWIYGPVMPLLHLPAAVASSATVSLLLSGLINLAVLLGPMIAILWTTGRSVGLSGPGRGLALAALLGGIPLIPHLRDYLFWIHADQVAIGFALLSCAGLSHSLIHPQRSLLPAALWAVLAIWTKQVAVLLPVGQLVYLALQPATRPQVGPYLIRLLGAGAGVSAIMVGWWGLDPLVFNLWIVPAGHGLKGGASFVGYTVDLLLLALPASLLCIAALRRFKTRPADGTRWCQILVGLMLTTAWIQVPLQLLSANKHGGSANSIHAMALFFMAATVALLALAADIRWPRRTLLRWAATGLIVGAGYFQLRQVFPWRLTPADHIETDIRLATQYPGEIYFPDNPLISWWAEKKAYHFEYGLVDQAVSGFPVNRSQYLAYLPANVRLVVYSPSSSAFLCPQILPDLQRHNRADGRTVFMRMTPGVSGAP